VHNADPARRLDLLSDDEAFGPPVGLRVTDVLRKGA
jgi:hypothetical protein